MTATPVLRVGAGRQLWSDLLVTLAVLMALAAAVVATAGPGPAPQPLDQQAQAIAAGLRCPVCTDLSAADSPAPLARQMRRQIRQELAAGIPREAIRQRFVDAYGPSVLLTPPDRGWGRSVRLMPVLVVGSAGLAGALVVQRSLHRARRRPQPRRKAAR
jgi:cytochrome c-type biogenesis protein CcmH